MGNSTTKTCTCCGHAKPYDQFHKDRSRRDGYRDRCKACVREQQADWRPDHLVRLRQQAAAVDPCGRKTCTACGVEAPLADFHKTPGSADGRRSICKSCACEYQHSHRHDPRYAEKVRERDHLKYHTMPDAQRKQSNRRIHNLHKARYWSDPDYQTRERKRINHKTNRRRLRKTTNGGSHTLQQWLDLCALYDHRCLCCGLRVPLTRDHIVPVECGGSDDISNIQPLCKSCNSAKSTQTIDYRPS